MYPPYWVSSKEGTFQLLDVVRFLLSYKNSTISPKEAQAYFSFRKELLHNEKKIRDIL